MSSAMGVENEKRRQFNEAVQEMQNVFYDVYSKFESFETETERHRDEIVTLKEELKESEAKRQEIAAKYSNLRVRIPTEILVGCIFFIFPMIT